MRSFLEAACTLARWPQKQSRLRAGLAGAIFALCLPVALGGGLAHLQAVDWFGCALPAQAVAAANLWIVLHRSNADSLFAQLCEATGEALPSALLARAKLHALPVLAFSAGASLLSLLFCKLPTLSANGALFGLGIFGLALAPGLCVFLANLGSPD